jgi:acetolactate synthase I/II/III large subunit
VRIRGAELVVRALEDAGARWTFGIPGTHNIELYDALVRSETVTAVLVTDEQSAGFMADGVSRSSPTIGVVNVVPGAGVTHALSGIAEALLDGVPIVVLACGIRRDIGLSYQLHEIDQAALLAPVTKAVLRPAAPDDIYGTVRQAFALAAAGTPGPVAVEIPADSYVLTHDVSPPRVDLADAQWREANEAGRLDAETQALVGQAAALVNAAGRVLVYAGYGTREAGAPLLALAERLGAPVATSVQGKGVFPEHHPLFVWNGVGATVPGPLRGVLEACDLLLAVGVRFSEVGTGSFGLHPPTKVVHVDINADVFNRNVPATIAIPLDASVFLTALAPLVSRRPEWGEAVEHIANGHRIVREGWARERSQTGVTPAVLFEALQQLAPDAIYTTDSGNGTFLAMEHLRLNAPGRFLAPVDYSCMGYAVPAAIGAKLANPDRDVIALAGDGALLMTGLELLTASSCGVAPLVCVLRDGELGQIAQFQRKALGGAQLTALPDYDLEAFARTVGASWIGCSRDAEVGGAMAEALASARRGTPVIVDVAIDYSQPTFFTRGVIATNFWRLSWPERLRLLGRAVSRRLTALE